MKTAPLPSPLFRSTSLPFTSALTSKVGYYSDDILSPHIFPVRSRPYDKSCFSFRTDAKVVMQHGRSQYDTARDDTAGSYFRDVAKKSTSSFGLEMQIGMGLLYHKMMIRVFWLSCFRVPWYCITFRAFLAINLSTDGCGTVLRCTFVGMESGSWVVVWDDDSRMGGSERLNCTVIWCYRLLDRLLLWHYSIHAFDFSLTWLLFEGITVVWRTKTC